MAEKCGYGPCKCRDRSEGGYCSKDCEALGGGLLGPVGVTSKEPLKTSDPARLKCSCGHAGCVG